MTGELQGVALVAAAGEGRRMGPGAAKVLRLIHGEPVLVATIRALQAVPEVEAVFLVIPRAKRRISGCCWPGMGWLWRA